MSTEKERGLFTKLEKIFGFSKDEQIFIPKELAKALVADTNTETRGRKPKIVDTPLVQLNTTTTENTDIFDLTDVSDIDSKVDLKLAREDEKGFASRVFHLFDIAKQNGITQLNLDQLTCAYYKVYSANNRDVLRTKRQIANKLYYLDFSKKRNARNAYVVKAKEGNSTYTMSDYK